MQRIGDDLEAQIIGWLEAHDYRVWRCDLGGALEGDAGWPHIGAAHRYRPGRPIGIVVAPGGLASGDRRAWRERLTNLGALVIVASSLADVTNALQPALAGAPIAGHACDRGNASEVCDGT